MYYVYQGNGFYHGEQTSLNLTEKHLYILREENYHLSQDLNDPLHVMWFHASFIQGFRKGISIEHSVMKESLEYHLIRVLEETMESSDMFVQGCDMLMELLRDKYRVLSADNEQFSFLFKYIQANLNKDLSNGCLAQIMNYSEKYFSRTFKEICQITPQQYVKAARMGLATKLLLNRCKIDQVAIELGYENPSNFCRDFKLFFNISPTSYVKQMEEHL